MGGSIQGFDLLSQSSSRSARAPRTDVAVGMPRVHFTGHLRRSGPSEPVNVRADTVGQALEDIFQDYPELRPYVLDDHNRLRRNIAVFVDGHRSSRTRRACACAACGSHVVPALAGG
jgi:molybdopterin synthase sulfur carrier subunit